MKPNYQRGFVALVSVVLISMMLLTYVVTLGASSYFTRFDALDTESQRTSLDLAESCTRVALGKLAQDNSYTPAAAGECVGVGGVCGVAGARTCKICEVDASGSSRMIFTRAMYGSAYTNLRVSATLGTKSFTVTEWKELSANAVPTCTLP